MVAGGCGAFSEDSQRIIDTFQNGGKYRLSWATVFWKIFSLTPKLFFRVLHGIVLRVLSSPSLFCSMPREEIDQIVDCR